MSESQIEAASFNQTSSLICGVRTALRSACATGVRTRPPWVSPCEIEVPARMPRGTHRPDGRLPRRCFHLRRDQPNPDFLQTVSPISGELARALRSANAAGVHSQTRAAHNARRPKSLSDPT